MTSKSTKLCIGKSGELQNTIHGTDSLAEVNPTIFLSAIFLLGVLLSNCRNAG